MRCTPHLVGIPIACNRGEAKHQELKMAMLTCSGRDEDVHRHFARNVNTSMALKGVKGRLHYLAKVHNQCKGEWEDVIILSNAYCAKAIDILDGVLRIWGTKTGRARGNPTTWW